MKKHTMILGLCTMMALCFNSKQAQGQISLSDPIAIDSANKMISSYLNSINYTVNDTDLFSIIVDAHQLRNYLDSIAGANQIVGVKLMLAHKLNYINSGGANQPAGYSKDALTIVIAAYDDSGNYVFLPGTQVMDYNNPCPSDCPSGDASNPLIIQ